MLDVGSLHEKVKAHCQAIINDPSLLLAPEASYASGAMDGKIWERADAFYAVQKLGPTLPHLKGALVAFFEGALETWDRFTSEFAPGEKIATASDAERHRAWMKPTNDDNEGGLGERRKSARHAPNMTLEQHNARVMYQKNNTAAFIQKCLTLEDRKYLRKRARDDDASGMAKRRRKIQAEAYQVVADKKRTGDVVRKAAQAEKRARVDAVSPRLDVESIRQAPGTNAELDLQLEWHRRRDSDVPKVTAVKLKNLKIEALVAAVERHNCSLEVTVPTTGDSTVADVQGTEEGSESDSDSSELYH